jgi:hypothetical protein
LSFDENILAFFVWQLFWLLFPKFGHFFPKLLVTLPPTGSTQVGATLATISVAGCSLPKHLTRVEKTGKDKDASLEYSLPL